MRIQKNRQKLLVSRTGSWFVAVLSFFSLAYTMPALSQDLQRLFTTPEQRASLDRLRMLTMQPPSEQLVEPNIEVEEVIEQIEAQEIVIDLIYELQGIVRRNNNEYTIWLNSEKLSEAELPPNMELVPLATQLALRIHKTQTGQSFDVMPGQTLNFTTGQLLEYYQVPPEPELLPEVTVENVEVVPLELDETSLVDDEFEFDDEPVQSIEDQAEPL